MHTKYLLVPFSYIFHPIFVSLYGTLLYFTFEGNLVSDIHMYFTFFQILLLTVILPLCFYLLLRILNLVSSFTEATLEERKIPIFIQMALMYVLLRYGGLQESEPVLSHFFEGGFISSFIVLISVSVGFKASLHMIGVTSLFVFTLLLISYLQVPAINTLVVLLLCMGFVASSRLFMKAHTPIELVVGLLIGVIPQYLVWIYKI
jgi:hypothetical protein